MQPNEALHYIRPDEVAECWDGVSPTLYQTLWDCVADYTGPTPEESEEPVHGLNCVAGFWDRFDDATKAELNAAAEAQDFYDEHQPDEAQEWHDFDPDC